MNLAKQMTMVVALLLGLAAPVGARTWRVMRDGTGDYATIQPAINGASPGDTILLGPGRYIEHAPFWPGEGAKVDEWPPQTYAAVRVDSLTIQGVAPDRVIIGPVEPRVPSDNAMGFSNRTSGTMLTLRDMTIENLYYGCYLFGRVRIESCVFHACFQGVAHSSRQGMLVSQSTFDSNDTGAVTVNGSANPVVTDCRFATNLCGVDFSGTDNALIANCIFSDDIVGAQFEQGTTGAIRNCHISSRNACITILAPSGAELTGNECHGDRWYCIATDATVVATGNLFIGGNSATIHIGLGSTPARFNHNHILKGSGFAVRAATPIEAPLRHFDFTNNYWGTSNADSIRAWILDHNDDPTGLYGQVDFEPFSSTPLPTERKSLGSVKGLR